MAIPDFQTIMLPFLRYLEDGQEHSLRETREHLFSVFSLTDEERKELLPSGKQPVFHNRVGWARTFLGKAGLLSSTRRGYFEITERGQKVLAQNPDKISRKSLRQFPDYHKAWGTGKTEKAVTDDRRPEEITPEESLEAAYQELQEGLAADLLENIKECSSAFFERLVVDLLVEMGYGGSRKEAGKAIWLLGTFSTFKL